mmetsp:Transcript_52563/g.94358  ORF Transcript_52563/g.94358 Transcript_52563/m.94358 type:complete len:103 (-) Transcript_52563:16-324(-)|eukprot:CAMPEP_0197665260 /NCGR_PEP_ID=MMETSP1338-20131121/59123_1 /TAXON_ID=43686 ORGANISM="Pelagodinium beii, Strain RCC1491" /NCGR_SAMPLE_ID=MMETSP1338 /ASSEMBLY_ACC=CAM_ASM_000754 /LENGTH=102 /DNA_ID=CAMNT_0043244035 /DNA_START=24 /DNA_END=332 /DNA_ORIENTATION=-
MADQKDKQIQEAKALQSALEQISARKQQLEKETSALQAEEAETREKVRQLTVRTTEIDSLIGQKSTQLAKIRMEMEHAENEYMACLEAQPSLVHVMKKTGGY